MKRKYLSALLMGTLTVASMSTFTSCKDYDDDISNLQGQIDKLATADQLKQKVEELQALISSNQAGISSLETKLAEVKATADSKATLDQVKDILTGYATNESVTKEANEIVNAAIKALQEKDIKDLKALIETAQGTADKAVKDAADAKAEILKTLDDYALKSDVDAAQGTADDALAKAIANKTAIENALKTLGTGFDEKNTVAAAIEAINGQLTAKNTGLAGLDGRLSVIEAALKSDEDGDKLTNLKLKIDNIENKLKDIIGQYSTMVTDVQLFKFAAPSADQSKFDNKLNFFQAAEQKNTFPKDAKVAGKQLTFEDGKYYIGDDSLIVRVSPVDAELTASNVSLINSQGKELNGIVDVTSVSRYNSLLTSRSGAENGGLWVVKFKATEMGDKFAEAEMADVNGSPKKILYAVAVKNTYNTTGEEKDEATRRVTSEFDVNLASGVAKHVWDFDVNGTSVAEIHNRYESCENGADGTATSTTSVKELVWKMQRDEHYQNYYVTATDAIEKGDHVNVVNRPTTPVNGITYTDAEKDNRQDKPILAVAQGQPITIDFSNRIETGVKGFYVTLDEHYALESTPSELNAWNSYTYKGVGYKNVPATLFEGGKGEITIENTGNVQGDIIGFRVYAVNYDGTLTDPDGRSFYVAVGDVLGVKDLGNSDLTLTGSAASEFKFESTVALSADLSNLDFDDFTGWKITAADASGTTPTQYLVDANGDYVLDANGHKQLNDFDVKYYDKDGKELPGISSEVKSVKFILLNPKHFIDGATYNVTGTLTKKIETATSNVCVLNASFTKKMPESAPAFCYRDGFDKFQYIVPDGDSYVINSMENNVIPNKDGAFKLRQILIINNNKTWNGKDLFEENAAGSFEFNVANGTYENNKLAKAKTEDVTYILKVDNSGKNLVDNTTERTIAAVYDYKNISKRLDDNGHYQEFVDFYVDSKSSEKIVYCSWMKTFNYDVKSDMKVTYTPGTTIGPDGNPVIEKKEEEQNPWLLNNEVEWNATMVATGKTLLFSNLLANVSDLNALPVTTGVNGATMDKFFDSNVIAVVGTPYTTSIDGTQKNPYFDVAVNATGVTLTQKSQQAIPSRVTGGKIHFTIRDCFGNTKAIELPFKIKVNAVPSAARKH